ncbi:MAG: beta-ketoacyl synthase N-terminal-like domain-containing protein, partial [Melioribacteraceae bacterium]|nr:beta-ketoacyl synthase N-terminal-like domain-containing protein [Melioribacteraceae bacterium]
MLKRRVVITGLGAVTPIGNSLEDYWKGLLEGKSGAAPITRFDTTNFTTKFACELKGFDASEYIDAKAMKRMDPFTHYSLATAQMALDDSGLDLEDVDLDRFGVIYG